MDPYMENNAPGLETSAEPQVDSDTTDTAFSEEYKAFLEYKQKQENKKADRKRHRTVQWIALLLILAFVAGIVVDGQTNIYDRTLDAYSTLMGNQPASSDTFVLDQQPPTSSTANETTNAISPVVAIAKKSLPSIVAIESTGEITNLFGTRYQTTSTGSGIIISEDGYIVTNQHVVNGANALRVILQDHTEFSATLIGQDALSDLAIIKIDKTGLPAATIGDSSTLEVGELVVAIGSPVGLSFAGSVTSGIISGINREVYLGDKTMNLIQTDAAINPGNSGGALVNSQGEVIGINVLKFADAQVEGMSFSIPINEAKPIIEELINKGEIIRPNLGIRGRDVQDQEQRLNGWPQGVVIEEILPDSGAFQAGLSSQDIITHVNDVRIDSIQGLIEVIQTYQVEDIVTLTLWREEQTIQLDVTLTPRQN